MYDLDEARPIRVDGQDLWFSNLNAVEMRIQEEIAKLEALEQRLAANPYDRGALEQIFERADIVRELLAGQKLWIDELNEGFRAEMEELREAIRGLRG